MCGPCLPTYVCGPCSIAKARRSGRFFWNKLVIVIVILPARRKKKCCLPTTIQGVLALGFVSELVLPWALPVARTAPTTLDGGHLTIFCDVFFDRLQRQLFPTTSSWPALPPTTSSWPALPPTTSSWPALPPTTFSWPALSAAFAKKNCPPAPLIVSLLLCSPRPRPVLVPPPAVATTHP